MLTYPMSRSQYLLGKVLFNVFIGALQSAITVLLAAAATVGTAGWFFFYAIFALRIRRNDAFNTVTSVFYFVFLFASSMFYPLDPLPRLFRLAALLNPITWHVDVLRYATIGVGRPGFIAAEAAAFVAFTLVSFAAAIRALEQEG